MRIKFWGTRGTRPTPGRRTLRYGGNTTCVEVRDKENNLLVIDSGSGIAELGSSFSPSEPVQAHLLITHTHLDHIQGFPFFLPSFVPGTHLTIVWPAGPAPTFTPGELKPVHGFGPSGYEEAFSPAEQAGVRELAFFHRDPMHSDTDVDALIEQALGNHRASGGADVNSFPAAEEQELAL